jgi:Flp pilus assembly protein TadG
MFKRLRRFLNAEDGVTAVEFSLVGMPFILLILGLLEIGLIFTASSLLEGGTTAAARLIRTGQLQSNGNPEGLFRDTLCNNISLFLNCDNVRYEVVHLPDDDFTNASSVTASYDADGQLLSSGFDAGEENDVILIRSFYRYPFMTLQIGPLLSGQSSDNAMPLMSTMVIKNEPYRF